MLTLDDLNYIKKTNMYQKKKTINASYLYKWPEKVIQKQHNLETVTKKLESHLVRG